MPALLICGSGHVVLKPGRSCPAEWPQRCRLEVGDFVDIADDGNDICGVSDELHRRRAIEYKLSSVAVNDRLEASAAFDDHQSAGVRFGRRALAHTVPLTLRQCV